MARLHGALLLSGLTLLSSGTRASTVKVGCRRLSPLRPAAKATEPTCWRLVEMFALAAEVDALQVGYGDDALRVDASTVGDASQIGCAPEFD